MENNKKKIIMLIGIIVGVLVLVLGSAYAFFTYQRAGQNNVLVVGDIYMHYTGENAGINIPEAVPTSAYDESQYFQFTIDGKNTYEEKDIWYEIDLIHGEEVAGRKTRINDKFLRFTLTEKVGDDGEETTVLNGVGYNEITETKIYVNKIAKNTREEVKITYKLYMWITNEVNLGDGGDYTLDEWNNDIFASIKVRVKGDFNEKDADEPDFVSTPPEPEKKPLPDDLPTNLLERIKRLAYYRDGEIVAVNKYGDKCKDLESCADNIREYRYSGPEVNNYIYLKDNQEQDEKWRIIGIFTDEDTSEEYIKVIRDEVLPAEYIPATYKANGQTYRIKTTSSTEADLYKAYWNRLEPHPSTATEKNNWSTAGLQYYLNGEQDEDGSNKGYLYYLSSGTKGLLKEDVKYYLGTVKYSTDNAKTAYEHERDVESCVSGKGNVSSSLYFPYAGCNVWNGNNATWTGTVGGVGLMYPSDYGYSASSDNWDKALYGTSSASKDTFYDTTINSTSWMYSTMTDAKSKYSWTISPSSSGSDYAIYWSSAGYLNDYYVYNINYGARAVLNLKSETTWISGEGTSDSPYVVISE